MHLLRFVVTVIAPALVLACASEPDGVPPTPPEPGGAATAQPDTKPGEPAVAFDAEEVRALFARRCTGCHSGDHVLDLSGDFTRATVGVRARGEACGSTKAKLIEPGDKSASLLFRKVQGTQECGKPMPYRARDPKLTPLEIERLGLYIDSLQ